MLNNRRTRREVLPLACPVCSCERIDDQGRGINCVCTRCGEMFTPDQGRWAFRDLVAGLTGSPALVEPGDVLTYLEDPDTRPYLWDLEP